MMLRAAIGVYRKCILLVGVDCCTETIGRRLIRLKVYIIILSCSNCIIISPPTEAILRGFGDSSTVLNRLYPLKTFFCNTFHDFKKLRSHKFRNLNCAYILRHCTLIVVNARNAYMILLFVVRQTREHKIF